MEIEQKRLKEKHERHRGAAPHDRIMNAEDFDYDDVLFDRLVDGELSAEEKRRLLASLDDRTDGWRRCALAFLQSQAWGSSMRSLIAAPDADAIPPASTDQPDSLKFDIVRTVSRPRQWKHAASWLAMAAGLMIAFGLGQWMGGPSLPTDSALVAEAPTQASGAHEAAPLSDENAVTLFVQDHQGRPQRVQVPLVEGNRLGEQFADAPQWAPAMRQQFEEQGLQFVAHRRYAPLFFQQKNRVVPMIVPVDDAVITPVSRPIY